MEKYVVHHETAHQWFYSLVGNDQALDPWLDEALATWAQAVFDRTYNFQRLRRPSRHVGAPMPGAVVAVVVAAGEAVAEGQKLITMEAMKMETTLYAERAGTVAEVLVRPGTQVEGGDLLIRFEG